MVWQHRFSKGILVKFFDGGVWIEGNLRPGGRIRPHRPFTNLLNDTTINERTRGRGRWLERPGDGVASSFCEGILVEFFGVGGGVG
jgi:hypothetical protein